MPRQRLAARVLADDNLPPVVADSVLGQLLQATIKQLEDRDFAFELLLADTDEVSAQADAMFSWTRSFLGGFGLGTAAVARPCPKRVKKR